MEPTGVSGTVTISDQRSYIKTETLCSKNPTEINSALSEVCGECTVDHSKISHWANSFLGGCVSIDNHLKPGRPRTLTDERNVKLVADALEEDLRATCEGLSRAMGVRATSVFRILTNDLKKRKISVQWVPHCLTAEQKQKRLDIAILLKERLNIEDQVFFSQIVAIDKKWIKDFKPELKSQFNEWRATGSSWPKKF